MMDDDLALIWKALSDPTRRQILDLLKERPRTTGELSEAFAVSRFAVMKHLTVLEGSGLVLVRRNGRERWNYLNAVPLQMIYERWIQPYQARWASSLIQLKQTTEMETDPMEDVLAGLAPRIHLIEQEIMIEAPPLKIFDGLLDVNAWWGHRFGRVPDTLRLEAKVGGRFWETLSPNGDDSEGVLWGTVASIRRGESIKIVGNLGLPGAVSGAVTLRIEAHTGGSKVQLSHQFMGDIDENWRASFHDGWKMHLDDLKLFVETGKRVSLPSAE